MPAEIAWGIDGEGICRYVTEVPNGNACGCFCLHCGEPLKACHPKAKIDDYFAHCSGTVCSGETILHKLAKLMLEELAQTRAEILLPAYYAKLSGEDILGHYVHSVCDITKTCMFIKTAESEIRCGNVIIDSLATDENGGKLGIEIYVRNRKTDADRNKFNQLPFEVIEIDLSQTSLQVKRSDLEILLLESANRRWLNDIGRLRCEAEVARQLPLLIAQRNREIETNFALLKDEIITYSQKYSTRVADLKSQRTLLANGSYYTLDKHVSVMNIRPEFEDLFGPSDDYIADVVVNGEVKQQTIKIVFICGGYAPKLRKPHVIFYFESDRLTDTFSLEPVLKGVATWKAKLEHLALSEASKINQSYVIDS